jgi:hypothetical protein
MEPVRSRTANNSTTWHAATMNWSKQQIRFYNELLGEVRAADSWLQRAKACFPDASGPGAVPDRQLLLAEKRLGRSLPDPLRVIYRECGGVVGHYGTPLVMPLDDLVKRNEWLRGTDSIADLYMPFDHLLFFGEEGNGDLHAFPIAIDGSYGNQNIYEWNHENDSRSWRASSIDDLFARLATDWSA